MKKTLRPLDRIRDSTLETLVSHFNVRVTRIEKRIHEKRVILLRMKDPIPHVPVTTPLLELIFGDPARYSGPAFIPEETDPWTRPWMENRAPFFNCHAYALGDRIGLTPEDWVEGEPTDVSLDTNPMAVLLGAYFRQIRTLPATHAAKLETDGGLRAGDVLSFTRERPFWGTVHDHSGRIVRSAGEYRLISKFQAGRLLVTPLADALELYPKTTMLRVYRFLGNP